MLFVAGTSGSSRACQFSTGLQVIPENSWRPRIRCVLRLPPLPPLPTTRRLLRRGAAAAALQPNHQSAEEGGTGSGAPSDDEPEAALILVACGVGLATGAAFVIFNDAIHVIRDGIWHRETLLSGRQLLQDFSEQELWPKIVIPPVLGGLVVGALGLLVGGYSDPKPGSSGSAAAVDAANTGGGAWGGDALSAAQLRFAAIARPVSRAVAAAVTLGTGASLGPEGPSVDIGRSVARGLGSALRSRERHVTSLLAAGSGAGVAAGFNAPIAGVFFAVETVLQKQMLGSGGAEGSAAQPSSSGLTIAMVLLASVLASVVSQAGLGSSPAFRVPEYRLESLYELPLYLAFGALCGVVSASFSYSTRVAGEAFADLRQGNPALTGGLLPAVGGLTTGVLALGYPEILYQGFDNVNSVLSSNGDYAPGLLVQIVVMKIIATSICRGSGLQGGLYAPSIFVGAALGSAFGQLAHVVGDPAGLLLSAPQAYALVGVAAMLASNCAVPLTAVLLLFELTRDYLIIVPTLAAVGISFWISSLAAPSIGAAAARRRAAALAAAAAVAERSDTAVLDGWRRQLQEGSVLLDAAASPVGSLDGVDGATPAGVPALSPAGDAEALTLACAADRGCLLVRSELSLAEALALMEAEQRMVAVVLGAEGGVVGMVSRDVLQAQRLSEGESSDDDGSAAAAARTGESSVKSVAE